MVTETKEHTCGICDHTGVDVIRAEYYDRKLGKDVYDGWACKDIDACLDRYYSVQIALGLMKSSKQPKKEAVKC